MTDRLVLTDPGDLIATIPAIFGFRPRESLVVLGIDGRSRIEVALRVDRADVIGDEGGAIPRALAATVARADCIDAIVISVTDEDVRLACPAADAVVPALQAVVEHAAVWAVRHGRYFAPGCADVCCPPDGNEVPRAHLADARPGEVVARARRSRDARGEARGPMRVAAEDRKRAARAGDRWWARRGDSVDEVTSWRVASWARWERALDVARADAFDAVEFGKLAAGTRDVVVRDAVIMSLVPSGGALAASLVEGGADGDVVSALESLMDGDVRPDDESLDVAMRLVGSVAAHARGTRAAPVLEVIAFTHWWRGDLAAAAEAAGRAMDADEGATLAPLVAEAAGRGMLPSWTRSGS